MRVPLARGHLSLVARIFIREGCAKPHATQHQVVYAVLFRDRRDSARIINSVEDPILHALRRHGTCVSVLEEPVLPRAALSEVVGTAGAVCLELVAIMGVHKHSVNAAGQIEMDDYRCFVSDVIQDALQGSLRVAPLFESPCKHHCSGLASGPGLTRNQSDGLRLHWREAVIRGQFARRAEHPAWADCLQTPGQLLLRRRQTWHSWARHVEAPPGSTSRNESLAFLVVLEFEVALLVATFAARCVGALRVVAQTQARATRRSPLLRRRLSQRRRFRRLALPCSCAGGLQLIAIISAHMRKRVLK
mmetsp:Transcript_123455/g.348857  ORF Transcript_123455/g.348857 Transcript_123455/m.348857 type:complete len:304 (+) Transcript_123455:1016-1927(+)